MAKKEKNCPATYMDLYTIGCTIEPPIVLVYSKVYVDLENLISFYFCLHDLFVKNEDVPYYARPNHGKGALALDRSCRLN